MKQYTITLNGGLGNAKDRPDSQIKKNDDAWYYLGLVGQIGFVIALPIAGGAIIGSLAGYTVIGIIIGFIISIAGFVRTVQKIIVKQK